MKIEEELRDLNWVFNPQQREFVASRAQFTMGSGGKGSGKTVALCRRGILLSIDSDVFGDLSGNVGLLGRKTETSFNNTTKQELYKWLPRSWIRKENKEEGWIELINESVIYTMHLSSVERIVSLNLGWFGIDQAEEIEEEIWNELAYNRIRLRTMTKYRDYIQQGSDVMGINPAQPMFDDDGNCLSTDPFDVSAVLTTHHGFGVCNPRRCRWIVEKFIRNDEYRTASDPGLHSLYRPHYQFLQIPTTENRRFLPPGYIELQKQEKDARTYARDVEGSWEAFEGVVYVDFTDDLIEPYNVVPEPEWELIVAIDHGGTGLDSSNVTNVTSVLYMAVEKRDNDWAVIHVIDESYLNGSTIEETVREIIRKLTAIQQARRYRADGNLLPGGMAEVRHWRCDPSMARGTGDSKAAETIISRYIRTARNHGLRMALTPGNNNLTETIEQASWLMRKKLLRVNPRCVHFIDEHRQWEYGDNEKPKAKQCLHGDTLISTTSGDVAIKDLVGKEGFVCSYDEELGRITAKRFHDVRKTGENEQVVKVLLDDGSYIICTNNHPFMTRDGGWVDAGSLPIGISLQYYKLKKENVFNHKVVSVEPYGFSDVYNMEVEDTHNYAAGGVIVHNCDHAVDAFRYGLSALSFLSRRLNLPAQTESIFDRARRYREQTARTPYQNPIGATYGNGTGN